MVLLINQKIFIDRIGENCIISDNKFVKIYNFFIVNNYSITDNIETADIIILDLCGYKNDYLLKTEEKINNYLKLNKKIILFGCISDKFKEQYKNSLLYINGKNILDIEKYFEFKVSINKIDNYNLYNKISIYDTGSYKSYSTTSNNYNKKQLGFIHISDGCSLNCSYCNIKKIKGNTLSIQIEQILDEIKFELLKGKTDFYLLSDDCGSYGIDIGVTLADLIDKILELNENITLNITNIYPLFFIKFYDRLKKHIYNNKIISLVVPLQHTSKKILKLMNRNYDIESLMKIFDDIKKNSEIELINHIIFDYHEETIEEFNDTLKLLKYYNKTIYIKYSDINNTYGKRLVSISLKEKIITLKKLQLKMKIDQLEIVL